MSGVELWKRRAIVAEQRVQALEDKYEPRGIVIYMSPASVYFGDDDEPTGDPFDEYEPYPDNNNYCPKCGEVLSWVVGEDGGKFMCNHCGVSEGRQTE